MAQPPEVPTAMNFDPFQQIPRPPFPELNATPNPPCDAQVTPSVDVAQAPPPPTTTNFDPFHAIAFGTEDEKAAANPD